MSTTASDTDTPNRRSILTSVLLSLLMPGLGHLYLGKARRGLVLFGLTLASYALLVFWRIGALPRVWMLATILAFMLGLLLFTVGDAVVTARQKTRYELKRYNSWHIYAVAYSLGAAILSLPCLYAAHALENGMSGYFNVASASMEPTLRQGENLLADTFYYRSHSPARGEIVVYSIPKDPNLRYIKRVVAIAGDRVAVRDGRAIVNGTPVNEPYITVGDAKAFYNTTPTYTVPAGHVFVMGDNRANSMDSRATAQHGPVPVSSLIGRVTDIAFSREVTRIGRWVGTPAGH